MICKGFTSAFTVKQNRGFTIIELIVVLAVIAILAAALIPTLSNIVLNANLVAFNSIARSLNIASQANIQDKKANVFMHDAIDFALSQGYSLSQLVSCDDAALLWDSRNDLFCVYDGKNINYPGANPPAAGSRAAFGYIDYWAVYQESPKEQRFSIYWATEENFSDELYVGFDAGDNSNNFTLTYSGIDSVILLTNGQNVVVNDGEVYHYGKADIVSLCSTSSDGQALSYYEYGSVGEIKAEGDGCIIVACDGACFAQTRSDIIRVIGEDNFTEQPGAEFLQEPEHIHDFGGWINCGDQHMHYCKGCDYCEYGEHSEDKVCSCGYTTLPPGLYYDEYNKYLSFEEMINDELIADTTSGYSNQRSTFITKYKDALTEYKDFTIIFPNDVGEYINNAFNGLDFIYRVIIPYGVIIRIGDSAFKECTSLTEVYIPMSVIEIKDNAFLKCTSLSHVVIPSSVETVREKAFKNCKEVDCTAFASKPTGWHDNWCGGTTVIWRQ